jgi:chemotaxis protein methyltransferase CheR
MTLAAAAELDLEGLEIRLLLEGIFQHYGYDFRDYAPASNRRRINSMVQAEGIKTVSALQDRVFHDPACMDRLLSQLTIHVTAMFRDPSFYVALREKVVPLLATYPFARIWHAGCSSGEEVYSLAILLKEEGIYEKCRIYATDLSHVVLRGAQDGLFPLGSMKEYTENYQQAGGKKSFSEYYTAAYDHVLMQPSLRENIVFSQHNLVTDGSFQEFHLILCRNVMIYFNKALQGRVYQLLDRSLVRLGVLGLGRRESMAILPLEASYQPLDGVERLYRKMA